MHIDTEKKPDQEDLANLQYDKDRLLTTTAHNTKYIMSVLLKF